MRKFFLMLLTAVMSIQVPVSLQAQEVSDAVKRECRAAAERWAETIFDMKRRDRELILLRPSENWGEQVRNFMVETAKKSPSLTQHELSTLGFSYCIERRPRG